MPLVAHPVRSLWGSQPRCARCVCEWLHRKWDGAVLDPMFEKLSRMCCLSSVSVASGVLLMKICTCGDMIGPPFATNTSFSVILVLTAVCAHWLNHIRHAFLSFPSKIGMLASSSFLYSSSFACCLVSSRNVMNC